jgi:uncharacterized phage protein (TIGR01671 family)
MGRIIKFRAWNETRKEYSYHDLPYWMDEYGTLTFEGCLDSPFDLLEQYTGLHDKNGKEIYEGDIYIDTWNTEQVVKYLCSRGKEQKGQDGLETYMMAGFKLDFVPDQIEIIGNIHESK